MPISELADSIYAAQTAEKEGGFSEYEASNLDEVIFHPPMCYWFY